jgi:hypothetical protein
MFSSRTRWDLQPNRLSLLLARQRSQGRQLLDLTQSNPTHAGMPCPEDVLAPLAHPDARHYDPSPFGLASARAAVATDFQRRGFPVPPAQVFLSASTSEAYAFLFKLLADPGNEILVPRPGYPLFDFLATLESVQVLSYPLSYDGAWHLDVAALRSAVGPRTRAIVVVNPNNPTGAFLKRDELHALQELCAERLLALISDEVFADYAFCDDPLRAPGVAADGPALSFALGGLSKSCGLPQLKLAWTAVCGPERLRTDALARLEVIADTYLSVSTPAQVALPALLARRAELAAPIRARVRGNLEALRARVGGSSATLLAPEGGWYAVLRIPATLSEEERVIRLLAERDVLVHPGYFFDFPSEAHLVLSLLTPAGEFAEGVDRLLADIESS